MKLTAVVLSVLLLGAFGSGCGNQQKSPPPDAAQLSSSSEVYTCPMHPSVVSDRPGACPVCGMALVKRSAQHEITSAQKEHLRAVSLSQTQRLTANVATTVATRSSLVKPITAVGIVDYAEPLRVTVSARFGGRIEKLYADATGERIEKGEKLLELYSPDLVSAEQDFLLALEALSRTTPGDRSSFEQLLSTSRTRLTTHFGLTDEQIVQLERRAVVEPSTAFLAPISGTILRKPVQEGQYVTEGQELYELADLSRVWIVVDVYEHDLAYLRRGQSVSLTSTAYPGDSFSGTIDFIEPVMDPETRTVSVRTEFRNPSGKLKPQMFVEATMHIPLPQGIVIPVSALLTTGRGSVVWVETDENVFEPRTVTVGTRTPTQALILKGLVEGERVVTSGGYLLDSESTLRVPSEALPGQGHAEAAAQQKPPHNADELPQNEVTIVVKGTYSPDVIRVKNGKPVILHFARDEDSPCSEELVIEQLGIRQKLAPFKTTTIRFTPERAGVLRFSCGMDMLHGTIIVE